MRKFRVSEGEGVRVRGRGWNTKGGSGHGMQFPRTMRSGCVEDSCNYYSYTPQLYSKGSTEVREGVTQGIKEEKGEKNNSREEGEQKLKWMQKQ